MALITLNALGITLSDPLFSDLSLSKADRIGLVAANGRGKSNLLGCRGARAQTSGDITRARGLRVRHVTQNVPHEAMAFPMYDHVLASRQAEYESWRVDVVRGRSQRAIRVATHAHVRTQRGLETHGHAGRRLDQRARRAAA